MNIIKKVIKLYLYLVLLNAFLGIFWVVQAFWIPDPIDYESNAEEQFYIEKESTKQPCLKLSSNVKGKILNLNGNLTFSRDLCPELPKDIPIQVAKVVVLERWVENEILEIKIDDPLLYKNINTHISVYQARDEKLKLYLFFVFAFPFFWMIIIAIYNLFIKAPN